MLSIRIMWLSGILSHGAGGSLFKSDSRNLPEYALSQVSTSPDTVLDVARVKSLNKEHSVIVTEFHSAGGTVSKWSSTIKYPGVQPVANWVNVANIRWS